jgi:hypothetical protein
MVLRPGGGRRRASGLGEKRRVPRGLCRPPCAAVHASQSPFRTTRVCRGRGHSGVAKIRWGRWKLTLSWLPLCACPGTRPAPGVAEVPRAPTYALLVTVCSYLFLHLIMTRTRTAPQSDAVWRRRPESQVQGMSTAAAHVEHGYSSYYHRWNRRRICYPSTTETKYC